MTSIGTETNPIETRGAVSVVALNRPERRNALGTAGMQALQAALAAADVGRSLGFTIVPLADRNGHIEGIASVMRDGTKHFDSGR